MLGFSRASCFFSRLILEIIESGPLRTKDAKCHAWDHTSHLCRTLCTGVFQLSHAASRLSVGTQAQSKEGSSRNLSSLPQPRAGDAGDLSWGGHPGMPLSRCFQGQVLLSPSLPTLWRGFARGKGMCQCSGCCPHTDTINSPLQKELPHHRKRIFLTNHV